MKDLSPGWVMLRAIALSGIILVGLTVINVNPFVTFVLALLPLVAYHLLFLLPRARAGELTSIEIDSIYYYGFLLTIVALATSALTIVLRGVQNSLPIVGAQFGLGLLATGYAVAARIHLLMVSRTVEITDEGSVIEAYVSRSRDLISSIELASSSFDSYARSLQDRAIAAAEASQARSEAMLSEAAKTFRLGIAAALEEASASITEIRELLNDAAFKAERAELQKSVQGSVAAVTKLNVALEQMASVSGASAQSAGELSGALDSVVQRAGLMSERLDHLTADDGALSSFDDRLRSSVQRISESVAELQLTSGQFSSMAASASELTGELSSLKTASSGVAKSLQPLGPAVERIERVVQSLESADGALSSMETNSTSTAAALEGMQSSLSALLPLLNQFSDVGQRATPTLESMSNHVAQLEELAAALSPVAISMKDIADVLGGHVEQLRQTASANDQLVASIGRTVEIAPELGGAVASIPASLRSVQEAMEKTSASMASSADQLENAVGRTSVSLNETAATSADYLRQVAESLSGLASFIIERTNERIRTSANA
jgi:DNA repair ATPase RecN